MQQAHTDFPCPEEEVYWAQGNTTGEAMSLADASPLWNIQIRYGRNDIEYE